MKQDKNIIVIGCQWGDEGKGKIVDWLSLHAAGVVRFQGGHNAGHTLVINEKVYKLSLLPSGIVREGKISFIGNGVVIDPWALCEEIEVLQKQGVKISPANLRIAENAVFILPIHKKLDVQRESKATGAIGTTRRGIGPAYEDKAGRRALRFGDLAFPDYCGKVITDLVKYHNRRLPEPFTPDDTADLIKSLLALAPQLLPFCAPVWKELFDLNQQGKRILYEGAQGMGLDVDHGTYPYVTSCHITSGQAFVGSGLMTRALNLGIVKAYTTRVGAGPFPTEQDDAIGDELGHRGHEFGTVTGRKRRCGWLDAVLVRQAIRIAGVEGIALTKLDVLDTFKEIKIATHYEYDGRTYDYFPATTPIHEHLRPVYETMPGWQSETMGCRDWNALPKRAVAYIKRIEELIGVPVTLVSTSPEREDTILRPPLSAFL